MTQRLICALWRCEDSKLYLNSFPYLLTKKLISSLLFSPSLPFLDLPYRSPLALSFSMVSTMVWVWLSISTFTMPPTGFSPNVVTLSVSGMR